MTSPAPSKLTIPRTIIEQMISHAKAEYPLECCGLLGGKDDTASTIYKMTNTDRSPVSYFMDPKEQIAAFKDMREKGIDFLAIYHSHTHSQAAPSMTDVRLAYYPDAHYLIVSLQDQANPILRAFRIVDGQVTEEEFRTS